MPAPSPLKVATQAVTRLIKEETYYRKELAQQTERVKQLEEKQTNGSSNGDDNAEYMLKQEKKAVEETTAVFEPLKKRITEAVQRLEEAIATVEGGGADAEELKTAKEVLASAPKSDEDI